MISQATPTLTVPETEAIDSEFTRALELGLGRALSAARQLDRRVLTLSLMSALEEHRLPKMTGAADWILHLASEVGLETQLARELTTQTDDCSDPEGLGLRLDLLGCLAKEGGELAREALYRRFARQDLSQAEMGADAIISLDGVEGFLFVVETLGQRCTREPDYHFDPKIYRKACRIIGKHVADEKLQRRADRTENGAAFLEEIQSAGLWGPDTLREKPEDGKLIDALDEDRMRSEPATYFGELEDERMRAALLARLAIRGELEPALLTEGLHDASSLVRSSARRLVHGGLELVQESERVFEFEETAHRAELRIFAATEPDTAFNLPEILMALSRNDKWIDATDETARRKPSWRGPYRVDHLEAVHLRRRAHRDVRIAMAQWAQADPFFPIRVKEVVTMLEAFAAPEFLDTQVHSLTANPTLTSPSPESWDGHREIWLVDPKARRVAVIRFGDVN